MNNMSRTMTILYNLPKKEFNNLLAMWDKAFWDNDTSAVADIKDFCKNHKLCYKYIKAWLIESLD